MACNHHRRHLHRRRHSIPVLTTLTLLLFLSLTTTATQIGGNYSRERERGEITRKRGSGIRALIDRFLVAQRRAGPGSSPPTCRSKCGRCTPCKPVHVPIQPGMSFPLEYYPEAWRCKCGDKLFMP